MSLMNLTERQTLNFIGDYRCCSPLWDPAEKDYTNKAKRRAVYLAIGQKYDMTVNGVKSKIKNLRSYFLKEQQKVFVSAAGAGEGEGGAYKSPWFAYDAMSFIGHLGTSRTAKDALQLDYTVYDEGEAEAVAEGEGEQVVEDSLTEQDLLDESAVSCGPVDMLVQVETEPEDAQDDDEPFATRRKSKAAARRPKRKLDELDLTVPDERAGVFSQLDECSVFGEAVACQIRNLCSRNRAIARNRIQNVIFELEMQELDSAGPQAPVS